MSQTASPYIKELLKGGIKWMPFSKKTLETAIKEDKIIFVHIGNILKITEREAAYRLFGNQEIIDKLNTYFIPIAIDTEDVPEALLIGLDMLIITEQNFKIPINIFSLPGIKPFTSFSSMDIDNFISLTDNIIYSFTHKRDLLEKASMYMIERLANTGTVHHKESPRTLSARLLHTYVRSWESKLDNKIGYNKNSPHKLNSRTYIFFLKYYIRYNMSDRISAIKNQLDKIYYSCMFDPVEGGVFLTAKDYSLKDPLFEKSLSENTHAATLFSFAYKYFGDQKYRTAVERILEFIESEFKSPEGGYITYITLNKEVHESSYYKYSVKELKSYFPDRYPEITRYLGMTTDINEDIQQNISNTPDSGLITGKEYEQLKKIRRNKKEKLCDKRVITCYNCMYASSLCIISRNLGGNDKYIEQAEKIISGIIKKQKNGEIMLNRYMLSGHRASGYSDIMDYAMFLNAVINLYKSTEKEQYFTLSRKYSAYILLNFFQADNGMFSKAPKAEQITPLKRESVIDYIRFSANSVMARNMLLMYKITGENLYGDIFKQQLYNVENHIIGSGPLMTGWALQILNYLTDKHPEQNSAVKLFSEQ